MKILLMLTIIMLATTFAVKVFAGENTGTITVTGEGIVSAEPDEGYISIGVDTKAPTAKEALVKNTEKMETLFKTLKEFGIERKDFQTVRFNLQQSYTRNGDDTIPDGFEVGNHVRVIVCDLEVFGKVLDALVMGGANTVYNIEFGSSQSKNKISEARTAAVADAVNKAEQILSLLNKKPGKIVTVLEGQGYSQPNHIYKSAMAEMGGNVPVSGGSLTFQSNVTIVFEIGGSFFEKPRDIKPE